MRIVLPLASLALATFASAREITIGSPAPTFKVETMLKGKAVDLSKGVHVVEFWATWCVPCTKSIPHLTELAQKYKGKVDFTGVSVWERGDDKLGQARAFVVAMGPKMGYNVAFDGEAKAMDAGFLKAADQKGIPSSFLVKDGRVMWIGHPMAGLEEAIEDVLSGKFDLAKAKAEFERPKPAVDRRVLDPTQPMGLYNLAWDAGKAGDHKTALIKLDQITPDQMKELPLPVRKAVIGFRLTVLDELENRTRLHEEARAILADESLKPSSVRLRALSILGAPGVMDEVKVHLALPDSPTRAAGMHNEARWILFSKIPHPAPDYEAALLLIEDSLKVRPTAYAHDVHALALFKLGRTREAVEAETEAVRLANGDEKLKEKAKEFEARLAEYKKALG